MITAGLTTSFKEEILLGVHDLTTDVLKIALYTSSAVLGPDTTQYSALEEVVGAGYTAGGEVLLNVTVATNNGIAYASFDTPTWLAASFSARGALIYNHTKGGKSIGVLNFGVDQTTLNQTFRILLPTNDAESALIRIN